MIKIAILDDHELFRIGLKEIFRKDQNFIVVGEYNTINDCLSQIKDNVPDILLLDITLNEGVSFDSITKLKRDFGQMKIVMLTMHKKEFYVMRAIENRVDGYINKDINTDELFTGLKRIYRGERYFSSDVSDLLLNNMFKVVPENKLSVRELTDREREVLDKIMDGRTSAEIANELHIAKKTVDNHRANILKKFGFKSTTMLVRELANMGEI